MALQNFLLEPAGTLVKYGEELLGQPLNLIYVAGGIHIGVPWLALSREGDLVFRPFAGQMDAHTCYYGGRVPQAHGGQV